MGRRDISMTDDEVLALLESGRDLQVATIGHDGMPHLTTLWYIVDDGLVVFRSFTKSQRIVNLRRDPRLTVLVEEGDVYGELRGVMIQGEADLSDDPGHVIDVYAAVTGKMEGLDEPMPDHVKQSLFGGYSTKNTVVTVHPTRVISWDHRKI